MTKRVGIGAEAGRKQRLVLLLMKMVLVFRYILYLNTLPMFAFPPTLESSVATKGHKKRRCTNAHKNSIIGDEVEWNQSRNRVEAEWKRSGSGEETERNQSRIGAEAELQRIGSEAERKQRGSGGEYFCE